MNSPPTQHVFGRGSETVRLPICEADAEGMLQVPTIADLIPVRRIMTRDVVCAREDLDVGALLDLMVRRRIGCVPVVDDRGRPIGMVTKTDLVEHQLAAMMHRGPAVATAGALMMPLAITLDEHATVSHAAAMMSVEDFHHVAIVSDGGALIGVVSTMDIVRWLAANDGVTAGDIAAVATLPAL
ncbi:MAG TPA: CBS domain-containing protein [Kofleriaceae bacterium]